MPTQYLPTSQLDAVNIMLSTLGEAPVSDLSASGLSDVATAKTLLHNVSRAVQAEGWHFNTEVDYDLTPEAVTGYLLLPSNQLRVDTTKEYHDTDVAVRGDKLYNRKKHTFVFTEKVQVDMVVFLPFEDMPEAARNYITIKAARIYQTNVLGSELLEKFTADDEMSAMILLKDAEGFTADYNMLSDSYSVASILTR